MHSWHNCRQQTFLADSPDALFTYMPEPTGIWDRLRREMDFIEELPATGGWEDEQAERYKVGGKGV